MTSPSEAAKSRTISPVAASRMSMSPDDSGPSVTTWQPSGLQSTAPPVPVARHTILAADRPVERFLGLVQRSALSAGRACRRPRSRAGCALRVDRDVGGRRRGEPAGGAATPRLIAPAATHRSAIARPRPPRRGGARGAPSSGTRRRLFRACANALRASNVRVVRTRRAPRMRRGTTAPAVSWRSACLAPLERRLEPCAPVQLGVGSTEDVPADGGRCQVAEDALAGGVLVEPRPQPRPSPGEGLVGELERVVLGRDQPGTDEQRDRRARVRVAEQRPAVDPEPHRVAVGRRADQAQQDRPQRRALLGGQALVEPVGGSGDGAADAAAARGSPRR